MTDPITQLDQRGLLPDPVSGLAPPALAEGVDLGDRARGCLLAGAIGDALGRPAEGRRPREIRRRYGVLRDFQPWRGWESGPKGTWTDDTQLTLVVADSLLASGGTIDPGDLGRRLVEWLPVGRGIGRTCRSAVVNLEGGRPWWQAGVASAGNGAAMRAAPVGLVHASDPDRLRRAAALMTVITHADPTAVASAVAVAGTVADLTRSATVDPEAVIERADAWLAGVADPELAQRKPGPTVTLAGQLRAVLDRLGDPVEEVMSHFYCGAFVVESLPAAFWCFLRSPDDPEEVLVTAANIGHDADTVAAMAGNLVGAANGASALPTRWRDDLEERSRIEQTADELLRLTGHGEAVPHITSEGSDS